MYHLNAPRPTKSCKPCYPSDPTIRIQKQGVSISKKMSLVDVDSELLGLNRKSSNAPSDKYIPNCDNVSCISGTPCGEGVLDQCKAKFQKLKGSRAGDEENLEHFQDCHFQSENTRLSNPSCNLRGKTINRWEYLCTNPQERAIIPFDYNINNRIIVKDNHRPCIPTPIDITPALPKGGNIRCGRTVSVCAAPLKPKSVSWRSRTEINKY